MGPYAWQRSLHWSLRASVRMVIRASVIIKLRTDTISMIYQHGVYNAWQRSLAKSISATVRATLTTIMNTKNGRLANMGNSINVQDVIRP